MTVSERFRKALPRHLLEPAIAVLARTGISPNTITCLGFAITAVAGLLAAAGELTAAGVVSLVGGGLDALDGGLARATQRSSTFGALLDSTLDRYSEAAILLGVLVYGARTDQLAIVVLAGVALTGSFMVSYVRARAEGLNVDCEVGILTRTERVLLMALALIVPVLLVPILAVIALLANVTAVQRLVHVARQVDR